MAATNTGVGITVFTSGERRGRGSRTGLDTPGEETAQNAGRPGSDPDSDGTEPATSEPAVRVDAARRRAVPTEVYVDAANTRGMEVRDAVEADADDLAGIVDAPADVMRNVVHDRTVRVAVRHDEAGPNADTDGERAESILGFVSFDAREDTVYVTQLGGTTDACERLLGEPVRFATNERMSVELFVEDDDEPLRSAVESAGFGSEGYGPTFDGQRTVKYRLDPTRQE
jgi:hypothetical protein